MLLHEKKEGIVYPPQAIANAINRGVTSGEREYTVPHVGVFLERWHFVRLKSGNRKVLLVEVFPLTSNHPNTQDFYELWVLRSMGADVQDT